MKIINIFTAVLIMAVLSCKTQIIDNDILTTRLDASDYEIVEGVIHFRDGDAFMKIVNKAGIDSFQIDESKFKSFYHAYKIDKDRAEELAKDSIFDFKSKYVKSNKENFKINFTSESLAKVCDSNGLVYVGKTLMKFTDTKQFILKKENIREAINLNNSSESTDNVSAMSTLNSLPDNRSQARIPSLCRRLSGMEGANSVFSDASMISANATRLSVPTNENDQRKIYFAVTVTGNFNNSGYFDGSSDNNELQSVFTLDIYDANGSLATSNSHYNYSKNKGTSISYTSPYFYGTTCYSFQTLYTYANFREGNINPYPDIPCGLQPNCRQSLPIYRTDKHTVVASCTGDNIN